jgi:arginine decarboxylase
MYELNKQSTYVICNGFQERQYIENIARLINNGIKKIPIIDNFEELDLLPGKLKENSKWNCIAS